MLIGTLALSSLLASAGTSMANLALPAISTEFSLSFSNTRWVVLCYLISITVFSLIVGRLGDKNGRRTILILGAAIFSIGTFISTLSLSFSTLIFSRIIQGFGGAVLVVLPIAIVTDTLSHQKMGRTIGLLATMSAIGTATGPSIGGLLIEEFGWRSTFTVMTALGTLTLLLAYNFVHLKESTNKTFQQNKFLESLKIFYSDIPLRGHLLSNSVITAIMISTLIIGPFYLTHVLHLDPFHMGLIMSTGPITSILSGTLSGYAADRLSYHFVIISGFVQLLVGTISFIFLPHYFGSFGFVISAILLSLGYQLFLSANSSTFMKRTLSEHRGLAAGLINFSRNLGLISGTYLMGGIFDYFAKGPNPTRTPEDAITNGFQATLSIAAILIIATLFNQLIIPKKESPLK